MKDKLESRFLGEMSIISDWQMTAAYGRKWRRTKKTLDESERGEWKSWLKVNIQKTKIMTTSLIISRQIDRETMETVRDFIFLSYKITANCDWSHEIKRPLLFGIKIMTNLDRILKSRDIILQTNVHLVRAMVFPVVMYESWLCMYSPTWELDYKESWTLKNWCFWTVVLEKTLESSLDWEEIQ